MSFLSLRLLIPGCCGSGLGGSGAGLAVNGSRVRTACAGRTLILL